MLLPEEQETDAADATATAVKSKKVKNELGRTIGRILDVTVRDRAQRAMTLATTRNGSRGGRDSAVYYSR